MDIQFNGANSITVSNKQTRLVVDDNLKSLGLSSVTKSGDIAVLTNKEGYEVPKDVKLLINSPGEYEVGNFSIYGIAARAHTDEPDKQTETIYKILGGDLTIVILGHIYPELTDAQLESIGLVDVLFIPVGGHGYTLDTIGGIKLLRQIEPKLVVPTHYADKAVKYPVPQDSLEDVLKAFVMEPRERTPKLKLKSSDLTDTTQLIVLERS